MASLLDMTVRLGADTKQYKKALNQSKKDTDTWGKQINSAMKGVGGMMAAAFSVGAVFEFGKASVQAFNEAELAGAKLQTALKGREESYGRLVKLAAELQRATLFDDDATVEAMSFLAQMQLTERQIKELIPLVQDFAQAQNMDLATAAKMVGKSVVGSAMAMKKLGFEVKGAEGSAERFTSVMNVLNQAFGGQAEAAAKVGIGAVTQMSNSWGDFMEKVGSVITPGLNSIAVALNGVMDIQSSQNLSFWEKVAALMNPTGAGVGMAIAKSEARRILANKEQEKTIEQLQAEADEIKKTMDVTGSFSEKFADLQKQYNEITGRITTKTNEQKKEAEAIKAAAAAEKLNAENIRKTNSVYQNLQLDLKTLEESFDEAWDVSEMKEYYRELKAVEDKLADIKDISEKTPRVKSMGKMTAKSGPSQISVQNEPIGIIDQLYDSGDKVSEWVNNTGDTITQGLSDLNNMAYEGLMNFGTTLAEGMGEALATGSFSGLFNSFLSMMADFMSQFGKALIAFGIGMEAFQKALFGGNPVGAIIAGGALLVLAGVLKGILKKQQTARPMAEGGIVFGPTTALIGEYAGANSNPEVVAPLSDLKSMLKGSGGGDVTVKGRLVGADIMISNERSSYQRNRVRGF